MNALVTGVAGFIGSQLAEALLARGAHVTGLDCFTDYYARTIKERNLSGFLNHARFRFLETSIHEADLRALLADVTHVFHLAAQAGVRQSWGRDFRIYSMNNVEATQLLLEAAVDLKIDRFVFASSSSVYGDEAAIPMREDVPLHPLSPYGVTKLAAEHLCQLYQVNHGVPTVSLRYFTVYGPRQRPDMAFSRFLKAAMAGTPVILYGDGDQTRDFTYVDDAVAATVAAADQGSPGNVYNIGGGARVSINQVLDLVGRITARPVTIRHEPPQKGDMRDTYADTSRARADLAFAPAVPLEEGLRRQYRWASTFSGLT